MLPVVGHRCRIRAEPLVVVVVVVAAAAIAAAVASLVRTSFRNAKDFRKILVFRTKQTEPISILIGQSSCMTTLLPLAYNLRSIAPYR